MDARVFTGHQRREYYNTTLLFFPKVGGHGYDMTFGLRF